jgi:inosine/xanthosine triphosphate pyrophosphatase family protein
MAKSTKPMVRIHDLATNEVIDREMNDDEFAEYQARKASNAIAKAEADAKETAKAAILDRIGLTADELQTILG